MRNRIETDDAQRGARPVFSNVPRFSWFWLTSALAVGLVFGIGILFALRLLANPLALLILAAAIATALAPAVDFVQKRTGLSRSLATILIFLLVALVFVLIGVLIIPDIVAQARALVERLPAIVTTIVNWVEDINPMAIQGEETSILDTLLSQIGTITSEVVMLPFLIFSSFFDILLILFVALYWVILMPSMKALVLSLVPQANKEKLGDLLKNMGQAMGGYVRGTAIDAVIVGLLTYVGLLIIGVEYAGMLGTLAGLLEVIPILGPIIAGVLIVATALVDSPGQALIAGIFVLIVQQIESNILVPNIMKAQADVPPLLVLVAVYIGGTLGGLVWALASIPLVAILNVLFSQVVLPALRRKTGAPPVEEPELASEEGD